MRRILGLAVVSLAIGLGTANAEQALIVESDGKHGEVKVDEVVAGHLSELNGRYRLRVAEVTYDPGGHIGSHHHVGPGIRCVTAGQLTYVQPDKTTIYKAGDCFFESGAVSHTARNASEEPVVLLNFQLLPADWSKGSAIPPR
ncbi:MAG: cupin domain-containing protein [Myxococcota bacterium]